MGRGFFLCQRRDRECTPLPRLLMSATNPALRRLADGGNNRLHRRVRQRLPGGITAAQLIPEAGGIGHHACADASPPPAGFQHFRRLHIHAGLLADKEHAGLHMHMDPLPLQQLGQPQRPRHRRARGIPQLFHIPVGAAAAQHRVRHASLNEARFAAHLHHHHAAGTRQNQLRLHRSILQHDPLVPEDVAAAWQGGQQLQRRRHRLRFRPQGPVFPQRRAEQADQERRQPQAQQPGQRQRQAIQAPAHAGQRCFRRMPEGLQPFLRAVDARARLQRPGHEAPAPPLRQGQEPFPAQPVKRRRQGKRAQRHRPAQRQQHSRPPQLLPWVTFPLVNHSHGPPLLPRRLASSCVNRSLHVSFNGRRANSSCIGLEYLVY